MFRIEFSLKSSLIHKYTMMFTVGSLILTVFGQINMIQYIGATYTLGAILLGNINHMKYACAISGTGCVYDFFYVIFHSSDSNWAYVRCIMFIVHLLFFIYEFVWIIAVYCFYKQEEAVEAAKNKKGNWSEPLIDFGSSEIEESQEYQDEKNKSVSPESNDSKKPLTPENLNKPSASEELQNLNDTSTSNESPKNTTSGETANDTTSDEPPKDITSGEESDALEGLTTKNEPTADESLKDEGAKPETSDTDNLEQDTADGKKE